MSLCENIYEATTETSLILSLRIRRLALFSGFTRVVKRRSRSNEERTFRISKLILVQGHHTTTHNTHDTQHTAYVGLSRLVIPMGIISWTTPVRMWCVVGGCYTLISVVLKHQCLLGLLVSTPSLLCEGRGFEPPLGRGKITMLTFGCTLL
jgi:hypothetical protein